jgi:WXG100 family type VII secretion target
MGASVVRAEHNSLAAIAGLFERGAAGVRQSSQHVQRRVEALRGGGWLGEGAAAFYREMDAEVFPEMARLASALDRSARTARRISQIFLEAEQDAAGVMLAFGDGAGPGVTPATTDVGGINTSGLPAGRIREAAESLAKSKEAVDVNTARQLAEGKVKAYYMEDLKSPADAETKLKSYKLDPKIYNIYLHPETGAELIVQKNAVGFQNGNAIFGQKGLSEARWKTLLVHETNHVLNPFDKSDVIARYKSEFRAYSIAEYRSYGNTDLGAAVVKQHILRDYPIIKTAYDSDPKVKKAIDEHLRADGDVTNKGKLK